MDTTAAEATFTEIAFGLNVAFAFFSKGKEIHGLLVDNTMKEDRAILKVFEDGERLSAETERIKITKVEKRAKRRQHCLFVLCVCAGVLCALLCLIVLYANYLDLVDGLEIIYLVPIVCFVVGSVMNIIWFWGWELWEMRHVRAFMRAKAHFTLPTLPPIP